MILLILITFSIDDVLKLLGENWGLSYLGHANKVKLNFTHTSRSSKRKGWEKFRKELGWILIQSNLH